VVLHSQGSGGAAQRPSDTMADPNVGSNTLRVPGSESPGPIRISHRVRAHIQAHKEGAVVPLVMPVPVEAPAPPTLADRSYTEYGAASPPHDTRVAELFCVHAVYVCVCMRVYVYVRVCV
jgi:hypothetical protein